MDQVLLEPNSRWSTIGYSHYEEGVRPDMEDMIRGVADVLHLRALGLIADTQAFTPEGKEARDCLSVILDVQGSPGNVCLRDVHPTSRKVYDGMLAYTRRIVDTYNPELPYHTFEHAQHVIHSSNKLVSMVMTQKDKKSDVGLPEMPEDGGRNPFAARAKTYGLVKDKQLQFAMVFAALIHDAGHIGLTNSSMVCSNHERALMYNDMSVNEQHSLSVAFRIFHEKEFNEVRKLIFNGCNYTRFRKFVIKMVLATDIFDVERCEFVNNRWDKVFELEKEQNSMRRIKRRYSISGRLEDYQQHASASDWKSLLTLGCNDKANCKNPVGCAKKFAIMELLIRVADIAANMQSWPVFIRWMERIFLEQIINERSSKNRQKMIAKWYDMQTGFLNAFVFPLLMKIKECGVLGPAAETLEQEATRNMRMWVEHGEEISRTLAYRAEQAIKQQGVSKTPNTPTTRPEDLLLRPYLPAARNPNIPQGKCLKGNLLKRVLITR